MALPISIERLLHGHTVEGHRIEFKGGWNPAPIYRSICAFANDIANEGGGYIVVGVDEDNGLPIRPVRGLPLEEIDGKTVFVIWCPAGQDRPYEVPDDVTVKEKKYNYRVRYNSSSIVPKGQLLRELLAGPREAIYPRNVALMMFNDHPEKFFPYL